MSYHVTETARRRIRRNRARREAIVGTLSIVGLIAAVVGVLWFCTTIWFPAADCKSATRALDFIERCEAHADCKLRPYDLEQKEMLIRKQLRYCKN